MNNSINNIHAQLLDMPLVQRLNLELMQLASFNNFDGPKVVKDLLDNKDLWQACIMDREASNTISLIKLRDMGKEMVERLGYPVWNVDTLFILPNVKDDSEKEERLWQIIKTWNADEHSYLSKRDAQISLGGGLADPKVLRVFWD